MFYHVLCQVNMHRSKLFLYTNKQFLCINATFIMKCTQIAIYVK